MKIRVCQQNGETCVQVIDPTDGAERVVNEQTLGECDEIVLTATTAHAEGDIEVGEICQVASPDTEVAPDANPDRESDDAPPEGGRFGTAGLAEEQAQEPASDDSDDSDDDEDGE